MKLLLRIFQGWNFVKTRGKLASRTQKVSVNHFLRFSFRPYSPCILLNFLHLWPLV